MTSFAAPSDLEMKIAHAIKVPGDIRWPAEVGQRFTIFGSAAGAVIPLSTALRALYVAVGGLRERFNAQRASIEARLPPSLDEIRAP